MIPDDETEQRVNKRRVVSLFGNEALRSPPLEPSDILMNAAFSAFEDKYEQLAYEKLLQFRETLAISQRGSEADSALKEHFKISYAIENGYLVMGRILSCATRTYIQTSLKYDFEPTTEELKNLLLSDQAFGELVYFLANMPNAMNREYEAVYGLTANAFRKWSKDHTPFTISCEIVKEERKLTIYPIEELERAASLLTSGIQRQMHHEDPNHERKCPALEVLLPKLWKCMVTECAENPELFAVDLQNVK